MAKILKGKTEVAEVEVKIVVIEKVKIELSVEEVIVEAEVTEVIAEAVVIEVIVEAVANVEVVAIVTKEMATISKDVLKLKETQMPKSKTNLKAKNTKK
jgi:hypothetical protein